MLILNPLPAPSNAINGNTLELDLGEQYSSLATGDDFIVFRTLDKRIIIRYDDGNEFTFNSPVSEIFENTAFVSGNSKLFIPTRGINNDWFLTVFDIVNRAPIANQYLFNYDGFISLVVDTFKTRVVYYTHAVSPTQQGFWVTYDWSTGVVSQSGAISVAQECQIHLSFFNNVSGLVRSMVEPAGVRKISQITAGDINNELWELVPTSGETIIQDTFSEDTWYLQTTINNDKVFALSTDAKTITAFDINNPNTVLLTGPIDDRDVLQHSVANKVGYPRFFVIPSHTVFDSRTIFRIDGISLAAVQDYPVCQAGQPEPYNLITTQSDQQAIFAFSNLTKRAWLVDNYYELDQSNYCEISPLEVFEQVGSIIYPQSSPVVFTKGGGVSAFELPETDTGLTEIFFRDNDFIVGADFNDFVFGNLKHTQHKMFQLLQTDSGYVAVSGNVGASVLFVSIRDQVNNTSSVVSITTDSPVSQIRTAIIYNNSIYIWTPSQRISLELTSSLQTVVSQSSPLSTINMFTNNLNNTLYLYDSASRKELRLVNVNPELIFDYQGDYLNFTTLVTEDLPIANRPVNDTNFSIQFINELDIVYISGSTNVCEVIKNFSSVFGVTYNVRTSSTVGVFFTSFNNNFTYSRANGVFNYNGEKLTFTDFNQFNLEVIGASPYTPLVANIDNNLYLGTIGSQTVAMKVVGGVTHYWSLTGNFGRKPFEGFPIADFPLGEAHDYLIQLNDTFLVYNVPFILEENYTTELISEEGFSYNNSTVKIDTNHRTNNKRMKISVKYELDEVGVSFFLSAYRDQSKFCGVECERFSFRFRDCFRIHTQEFYECLITNVSYNWVRKDVYEVNLEMETI